MPFALPHTAGRRGPGATDGRAAAALGRHRRRRRRRCDLDALTPGSADGWAAYPAGVVWALREAGHPVAGADVHSTRRCRRGAGLSSSAALEVVVALALNDLYELGLPRLELARLCQRAENVYVGVPSGIMDQTASALLRRRATRCSSTPATSPRSRSPSTWPPRACAAGRRHPGQARAQRRRVRQAAGRLRDGRPPLLGVDALRDVPYDGLDAALTRLGDEDGRPPASGTSSPRTTASRRSACWSRATRGDRPGADRRPRLAARRLPGLLPRAGPGRRHGPRAPARSARRMTGGGFGGSAIVLAEAPTSTR